MTQRIYYTEPYTRTFDAVVTRAFHHDGRPAVTLDRTAFYPTSGGQPFDTGRLGPADVIDTVELNGDIAHVLSAPLPEGAVAGEIDWPRRFDHMQQHTGQHLLSAAFERLFDNATTSFHMGAEVSTIDLAREAPPADVEQAVDEANGIVWDDRDVAIRFASPAEVETLALRKQPARSGPLRLIEISGFDVCACGGTHVSRTGSIGLIAVLGTERVRGGSRLTFVCGGRALRALRTYRDAVAGSVRLLSVLPTQLPAAVDRVQGDAKALRKASALLQERLATYEGARLVAAAPVHDDVRLVADVVDGWDVPGLKALAAAAVAAGSAAVVLVSAAPPAVVVARSAGVPVDSSMVLRQLLQRFGGRGGGNADIAQGGGLTGAAPDIAAAARVLLQTALAAGR